jgi:hypothetical protein
MLRRTAALREQRAALITGNIRHNRRTRPSAMVREEGPARPRRARSVRRAAIGTPAWRVGCCSPRAGRGERSVPGHKRKGAGSMDEQTFQTRFNELLARIGELPDDQRNRLEQLAKETRDRRERIRASVSELQESLDYLRLSVKYLVFDLEATRRENAYLRGLLERGNRDQGKRRGGEDKTGGEQTGEFFDSGSD